SKPSGGGGGGGGGFSAVVMPKDDAELAPQTPTMPQTPVQSKVYTDVNSDFWANEAIQALSVKNAINGYEDGTFKPANLITRAEFIKILTSMLGYEPSDCSFADVSADKWYYGYIGAAVKLGIAKGDGELFNPDSPITRQDAATLLYRAIGQSKNDIAAVSFADEAEISDYASDAVKSLGSVGVLSGYPTGEFFPKNNMTRAEVAQMLYKATKAGLINR
ncbi:MAG: S-layer homology domain-containing protein, partial [Clostridia bacterium]|nr:S-layer homology domain-containing protein [Clostridia bacterium]